MMNDDEVNLIMDKVGYHFKNVALLKNALTHSSYANENGLDYTDNNERLEYLGDAVLELSSSRFIFDENPNMVEGEMSTLRASLVCEQSLAEVAREIKLDEHVILGHGEIKNSGNKKDSIVSDALEALIGAIYLDGGFEAADGFIRKHVLTDIETRQLYYDSKSRLQEIVQNRFHGESSIVYEVTKETGPAHDKKFEVCCILQDKRISEGEGPTKKKAEQMAAYRALLVLRDDPSILA